MTTTPAPTAAHQAAIAAEQRLQVYINRGAGQHKRAITASFSEARDALESRMRHQRALAASRVVHIGKVAPQPTAHRHAAFPDAADDLAAAFDSLTKVDPEMRRLFWAWVAIYALIVAGGVAAMALR